MTLSRHLGSLSSLGDSEDGTQKRRSKQNLAEVKAEGPEIVTDGVAEEVDEMKSAMAQLGNVFIKANLSRRLSGNLSQPESSEMDSGLSSTTPLASSMNLSTTLSGVNIKLKRVNTLGSSSSIESRANSLKKVPSTRSLRTMRANRVSKSGTLLLDSEQNEEDDQFLDEFKKENNIETISKRSTSKSSIMLETPENEIIESKTEDFVILSSSNHETVPEKSKLDVIGSEAASAESEDEVETETVGEADTQRESADILSTDVELPGIEDESVSEADAKEEEEDHIEAEIPNYTPETFENNTNDDENRILEDSKVDTKDIGRDEKNFDLNNVPIVVDTYTNNNLVRGDENQLQSGASQPAILQSDVIELENIIHTVEAPPNSQMEETLSPPKTELNDKNSVTKRVSAVIGKGLFGIFGSVLDSLGLKTEVEVAQVEYQKEDEISIDDVESDMFFQKDDSSWSHASPATDNNSPVLVEVSPTFEPKITVDDIQSNQVESHSISLDIKDKDTIDSKPIPAPVSDGQTEKFEQVVPTGKDEQTEGSITAQNTKTTDLMNPVSANQAVNEKELKAAHTPAAGKGKGKSRSKSPKSKQNKVLPPPNIAEKNDIPSIIDPKISNASNKLNLSTEKQSIAPSSQQQQAGLKEGFNRRKSKKEKSKQHSEKKSIESDSIQEEHKVVAKIPEKPLIPKPKATVQKEAPKIVSMSPAAKASLPNLTSITDASKATDPPKVATKSPASSASNITAKSTVDLKNELLKQKEESKTALSSKKKEKGKVDKKGASKEKETAKADTTKQVVEAKNEQTKKKDNHQSDVNKAATKPAISKQEMIKKDEKMPPKVIPKGKERELSVEKKVKAKSKTSSTTPSITETAKKTDLKVKEPETLAEKTVSKSSAPSVASSTTAKVSSNEQSNASVAPEKKDSMVAQKVDAKKTKSKSKSKNQRSDEEKKQVVKESTEVLKMAKIEMSPEANTKEELDTGVVNAKEASEIIDNKPGFIEESQEMQMQSESLVAQPEVIQSEEKIIPTVSDTKNLDSIQIEHSETVNTVKGEVKEESLIASESGIETLVVASRPQKAVYQPPEVDFSDIFHEWLGQKRGLFAFRIENFIPTLQVQPGMFCVADSYIILCTTKEDGQYFNQIYTWIGSESATDKMFCCAMYAVALRNQTNAFSKILRQVSKINADPGK